MTLLFTVLCFCSYLTTSDCLTDVRRTNQGVIFKAIKEVDVVANIWKSSFVVEIPKDLKTVKNKHHESIIGPSKQKFRQQAHEATSKPTLNKTTWFQNCLAANDQMLHGSNYYNASFAKGTPNPTDLCHTFGYLVQDVITMVKHDHDELVEVSNAVQNMLPPEVNMSRVSKRAPLEIIGRAIGSSLFGYAMAKDVEVMVSHVNHVTAALKGQTYAVQQALTDISMLSKNTNDRLNNMLDLMQFNAISTMQHIDSTGTELSARIEFITQMFNQVMKTRQHIQTAHVHYTN